MKLLVLALLVSAFTFNYSFTQENILPKWLTEAEKAEMDNYIHQTNRGITTPPQGSEIRTPGQWEENQAVVITWAAFPSIQRQLVQHIQQECEVWIVTLDSNTVKNNITSNGGSLTNVKFIHSPYNSIWVRDYGPNSVYLAGVDSLVFIDWTYNRPRYDDNSVPDSVGSQKNIPVYSMSAAPNDLVHTGGNFMADGFGTGFSSHLITDENDGTGFSQQAKTGAEINALMNNYMGIETYIKMTTLPYDDIHHIDMHMKLLNEEVLLVGEFPEGISDGPQIELNIQYIQDNYLSAFGTPYKIVRIPMPPNAAGTAYPGAPFGNGYYRTYANNIIVNKSVIVPIYREEYDTIAIRILQEAMPGYNVVGIDADDTGANLVSQGGVLHCITKEVAVADPLLISHQNLPDTYDNLNPYTVEALIRHKSGISGATLYYRTDGGTFTSVAMSPTTGNYWAANIPAQTGGTQVDYYIQGNAISGKTQVRPMVAPDGNFTFHVFDNPSASIQELEQITFSPLFPNPSEGLTCIPMNVVHGFEGKMTLIDQVGREVIVIHEGHFQSGERKYFVDVANLPSGIYNVVLQSESGVLTQKLAVK